MAFVGNAELIVFEIALVVLVGLAAPTFAAQFFEGGGYNHRKLIDGVSWAPPARFFSAVWLLMLLVVLPLAVYRIRTYGNWASGVNLTALVVFWLTMALLMLHRFFADLNLWFAFGAVLLAFGAAIGATSAFFAIETLAGVLLVLVDVWLLFVTVLSLTIAISGSSTNTKCISGAATWNGEIGNGIDNVTTTTAVRSSSVAQRTQQRRSVAASAATNNANSMPPTRIV